MNSMSERHHEQTENDGKSDLILESENWHRRRPVVVSATQNSLIVEVSCFDDQILKSKALKAQAAGHAPLPLHSIRFDELIAAKLWDEHNASPDPFAQSKKIFGDACLFGRSFLRDSVRETPKDLGDDANSRRHERYHFSHKNSEARQSHSDHFDLRNLDDKAAVSGHGCDQFVIYYVLRRADSCVWKLKFLRFSCRGDTKLCSDWVSFLQRRILAFNRPKNLLVFVNPYGGHKKAEYIYRRWVKPLFAIAGINVKTTITERANHAKDFLLEADSLAQYDGVIAVGGDGLVNEVLQGLIIRAQQEKHIDVSSGGEVELAAVQIRIGIIPAGSTNALSATIQGSDDYVTSCLHIIIGDNVGVDVCSVRNSDGDLLALASTACGYGFMGDTLYFSEKLRRCGPARYNIAALKTLVHHNAYSGLLRLKLAPPVTKELLSPGGSLPRCRTECSICTEPGNANNNSKSASAHASTTSLKPLETIPNEEEEENSPNASVISLHGSTAPIKEPHESSSRVALWKEIRGEFSHIIAAVTPCFCKVTPSGLSPNGHLGDGTLDLFSVGRVSRFRNLKLVCQVVSSRIDHMRLNAECAFRVTEFSFTPDCCLVRPNLLCSSAGSMIAKDELHNNNNNKSSRNAKAERDVVPPQEHIQRQPTARKWSLKRTNRVEPRLVAPAQSYWNIDGELVPQANETIHFKVHRQLISLFARGMQADTNYAP